MNKVSDDEQRIIHSEAQRYLSRLELETAARIARRSAQIGFLAAVKAMEERPLTPADVHQFFPCIRGSGEKPGHWVVTVNDADHLLVSQRAERSAEPLSKREYQKQLRNCASLLLDMALCCADNDSNFLQSAIQQPEVRQQIQ